MRIGLIDCDKHNSKNPFPNLALMKLSAWHKKQGDTVEWYANFNGHYDRVYVSKVFSFSDDYLYPIDATEIIKGGSGYAISIQNGREVYNKELDKPLPDEIEHIYPDYELYGITDTAYGFISRGCPRQCEFCHVKGMQGIVSHRTTNLSEFWKGQKNIVLLDPNISACKEWKDIFQELIDSKAKVDFSQGLDIRLMTDEKIEMLQQIKVSLIHFAWDRYEDKDIILPKLKHFSEKTKWNRKTLVVYVLVGNKEKRVLPEDLERIYALRPFATPYVMIYDKDNVPKGHELRKLQRWVNNRFIWESIATFDEYLKGKETVDANLHFWSDNEGQSILQ